ncbi:NHLP-related RiPP peptide [Arenimonas sp.]|uniref:NHLP-related RiPP peptide n=1 Tax=Arenimonas sp. TaxID=1872635 RepID=UPI0035B0E900
MSRPLSDKTASALLDKLASDDGFRDRFMANPKAATLSLGTDDPAADDLPDAPIAQLAPKESFLASGATMRESLVSSKSPFEPISFELS